MSHCEVGSLPSSSFSNLAMLRHIDISNCPRLTDLPKSFGKLNSLRKLIMRHCGISSLPDLFGNLLKLEELAVSNCPLSDLPSDFEKLNKVRLLTFIRVPWTSTPACIKALSSLHTLTLELPDLSEECEWLDQRLSTLRSYNRCPRRGVIFD
ncbi:hypothetical protein R1flu_003763 [Riccia fluitans]|uniref:Disease resistance R13L4/SHOC-2-like LRR domain-containing protein n=1 Tax=Riccia fluitans TaxID=41844 RepID=A0ABD1Y9X8_9MARC